MFAHLTDAADRTAVSLEGEQVKVLVASVEHPLPADNGLRLHLAHLLARLRQWHDVILVTPIRPGDDLAVSALQVVHSTNGSAPEPPP